MAAAKAAAEALLEHDVFAEAFELAVGRFGRRRAQLLRKQAVQEALDEAAAARRPPPRDDREADAIFWQRAWEPLFRSCRHREALAQLHELAASCLAAREAADAVLELDVELALHSEGWLTLPPLQAKTLDQQGSIFLKMRVASCRTAALLAWAEQQQKPVFSTSDLPTEIRARCGRVALRRQGAMIGDVEPAERMEGRFWSSAGSQSATAAALEPHGAWRASVPTLNPRGIGHVVLLYVGGPGPALQIAKGSHKRLARLRDELRDVGGVATLPATAFDEAAPSFVPWPGQFIVLNAFTFYRWVPGSDKATAAVTFAYKQKAEGSRAASFED